MSHYLYNPNNPQVPAMNDMLALSRLAPELARTTELTDSDSDF